MTDNSQWITELDEWELEEGFNLALIINGVEGDERKHAFFQYAGWLISMVNQGKLKKAEIEGIILEWNRKNSPPLPEEWIKAKLDWCWDTWKVKMKRWHDG